MGRAGDARHHRDPSRTSSADEASGIAEQLFLEGKQLMKAGSTAKACEKFQASHDADMTATGTLLNLGELCYERLGKNASAWAEFRQVAAESAPTRGSRGVAREHEARLLPTLSYLTMSVRDDARVSGLRVVLDQKRTITEAMWKTRLPVDPGEHSVVVDAPGRLPRTYKVVVGPASDEKSVEVLPLLAASQAPSPGMPLRRAVGYAVGGVGLVALGVGAAFGVAALGGRAARSPPSVPAIGRARRDEEPRRGAGPRRGTRRCAARRHRARRRRRDAHHWRRARVDRSRRSSLRPAPRP